MSLSTRTNVPADATGYWTAKRVCPGTRPSMIDLHVHILPGVDDGAADATTSAAMLQALRGMGCTTIVATPHLLDRLQPQYRSDVEASYLGIEPMADRLGLTLLPGFEVMLTPDLPQRLAQGEPLTLGDSRALLVELPMAGWPMYADRTLFDLQTAGYRVVLAHPERYPALQRDPDRIFRLVEQGVVPQVTTSCIAGLFGRPMQKLAERWLLQGAVHLLASDAHSMGRRMTEMPAALMRVRDLVGAEEVQRLTVDAPYAVLTDGAIPKPIPQVSRQPSFFGSLFRR